MSKWKFGTPVRVHTPEGDVYVANNSVHNHSGNSYVLFTVTNKKVVIPFVIGETTFNQDSLSGALESVMDSIKKRKLL